MRTLLPEEAQALIRGIIAEDPRWGPCRIIGMVSPTRVVNAIGFGGRKPNEAGHTAAKATTKTITLVSKPYSLEADTTLKPGALGASISIALFDLLKPDDKLGLRQLVGFWRTIELKEGIVVVYAALAVEQ